MDHSLRYREIFLQVPWVIWVCIKTYYKINVSGVFTPINPSYFDVHQEYKVLTHSHINPSRSTWGFTGFSRKVVALCARRVIKKRLQCFSVSMTRT